MKTLRIPVTDQQQWYELRKATVGASESAALFGIHSYLSKFLLWHQKAGNVATPDFDHERTRWGNRLQDSIAIGLAEDFGLVVEKNEDYFVHPTVRGMGATPDFFIVDEERGNGCFEIKNVGSESWRTQWEKGEDGHIDPPLMYALQLQHQLAVTGLKWGALGVLVTGNKGYIIEAERHDPTIEVLCEAINNFWDSISRGDTPPVEEALDLSVFASYFKGSNAVTTQDAEFDMLCAKHGALMEQKRLLIGSIDRTKAKILEKMTSQEAEVFLSGTHKATYKEVNRAGYVVEPTTYRQLRVTEIKDNGTSKTGNISGDTGTVDSPNSAGAILGAQVSNDPAPPCPAGEIRPDVHHSDNPGPDGEADDLHPKVHTGSMSDRSPDRVRA